MSASGYESVYKQEQKKAKPRRPFCIATIDDMSTRLSADFFSSSKSQQRPDKATSAGQETDVGSKVESVKIFDEDTDLMVNTSNFDSLTSKSMRAPHQHGGSKLSSLLPGHFEAPTSIDEPSVCSSFPCSLLKSYTSIVGRKNDRNQRQMESVGLKSIVSRAKSMASLSTTPPDTSASNKSASVPSSTMSFKSDSNKKPDSNASRGLEMAPESSNEEWSKYGTVNENQASVARKVYIDFVENKSIRRPLRRSGSSKDFFKRLQALESKVKYCHEQNAINLKSEDRNVRYGDPLPKKKIYRQLRVISQFERFIFCAVSVHLCGRQQQLFQS